MTINRDSAGGPPLSPYAMSTKTYDVLVTGGTVIDPSQGIHEKLDVAIKNGKIAAVAAGLRAEDAARVISADGRLVTPGFIDAHVHAYDGVTLGLDADHYCLGRGVTTAVDAGSMGHVFVHRFVRDIVATSITRVYTLVHLDPNGPATGLKAPQDNLDWLDPKLTAQAAIANRPAVVGVKVHMTKGKSKDPAQKEKVFLERLVEAAEISGLPFMVHLNDTHYTLKDHLPRFRAGDIFTHVFNDFDTTRPYDADGKLLPEVIEARDRGVVFDTAIGFDHPHFTFDVAEQCIREGLLPTTISSGLDRKHVYGDVVDLPTTVSKFLTLGLDLDQAIECVTAAPAKVFDFGVEIGTLKVGSQGDVSIFELLEGEFPWVDGVGGRRTGTQRLVNRAVIARGVPYINSYA